jgi:hypothetical protein
MAKKSAPTPARPQSKRAKERDARTLSRIVEFADDVAKKTFAGREPKLDIPTRTKSNTIWNKKRGILEMGDATAERLLFNLNQAKQFMQTVPALELGEGADRCAEDAEPPRNVLQGLHTVAGTKGEKTFGDQDESTAFSRISRFRSRRCGKSCTSTPRNAARWWATSRSWTTAMRSIAGGWARVATRCRGSSSRM